MSEFQPIENFVIYPTETGKVNVEANFQNDGLLRKPKRIANLFNKERSVITKHLKNIFSEGELKELSECAKFAYTAQDGKNYTTKFYNLRTLTTVGDRVNSKEATAFRKWATEILHEYIIKGMAIEDECLLQIKHFGHDYFNALNTLSHPRALSYQPSELTQNEETLFRDIFDKLLTTYNLKLN